MSGGPWPGFWCCVGGTLARCWFGALIGGLCAGGRARVWCWRVAASEGCSGLGHCLGGALARCCFGAGALSVLRGAGAVLHQPGHEGQGNRDVEWNRGGRTSCLGGRTSFLGVGGWGGGKPARSASGMAWEMESAAASACLGARAAAPGPGTPQALRGRQRCRRRGLCLGGMACVPGAHARLQRGYVKWCIT